MIGLHGLHVIETIRHTNLPAKIFQTCLVFYQRTRQAHEHIAPILAILNLIG